MISNERPSPFGQPAGGNAGPRQHLHEETLKTKNIQIERKAFLFALKENPRGRFLRITEDVSGRRDTIIIPAPGLSEFKKVFDDMVLAAEQAPPQVEKEPDAN